MKCEHAELTIPNYDLDVCGMCAGSAQGCLVECDAIHAQGKSEPQGRRLFAHRFPPCSACFKKVGTLIVSGQGENPTSDFGFPAAPIPWRSESIRANHQLVLGGLEVVHVPHRG